MQSIRALARAAPRASSRITTSFTRSALRPSFAAPLRSQAPRAITAAFSTSRPVFDASAEELVAKLRSELDIEQQNTDSQQTGSDSNVSAFLSSTDWQLHDTEGEQIVKLSKKYENELIEVRFTIADWANSYEGEESDEILGDEEEEIGDAQSGGANTKGAVNQGRTSGGNFKVAPEDNVAPGDREEMADQEDNSEPAFPANVNVLISRPNKGALRINLVTDSGEFRIESVAHLPSADIPEAQIADAPSSSEKLYSGPQFPQLDEELQALLENYLNERGIDTQLAMFIPEYIDVKEQKEYLRWLEQVRKFVE